jgi:hypothetical protein
MRREGRSSVLGIMCKTCKAIRSCFSIDYMIHPTSYTTYNQTVQNLMPLNTTFIAFEVSKGENGLGELAFRIKHPENLPALCQDLFIAQQHAERKTPFTEKLFGETWVYHTSQNPYIQVFLAGFYRALNAPQAYGPLLAMLYRNAFDRSLKPFDPNEEIGGALLSLQANYFKNPNNTRF